MRHDKVNVYKTKINISHLNHILHDLIRFFLFYFKVGVILRIEKKDDLTFAHMTFIVCKNTIVKNIYFMRCFSSYSCF